MSVLEGPHAPYVVAAFIFQIVLIVHFALRKWRYQTAMRHGWNVYALGLPAAAVSIVLLLRSAPWPMWAAGFLWLIWGVYGYTVEYIKGIRWRSPPVWIVLGPYLLLYLATAMFYWWPLALVGRGLWYLQAGLFIVSTILNAASHKRSAPEERG